MAVNTHALFNKLQNGHFYNQILLNISNIIIIHLSYQNSNYRTLLDVGICVFFIFLNSPMPTANFAAA